MEMWSNGLLKKKIGAKGFEPPASCSQSRRSAKLSYAPYSVFHTADNSAAFPQGRSAKAAQRAPSGATCPSGVGRRPVAKDGLSHDIIIASSFLPARGVLVCRLPAPRGRSGLVWFGTPFAPESSSPLLTQSAEIQKKIAGMNTDEHGCFLFISNYF